MATEGDISIFDLYGLGLIELVIQVLLTLAAQLFLLFCLLFFSGECVIIVIEHIGHFFIMA